MKCRLFQSPKLKTEAGDTFLVFKIRFFRGSIEDRKCFSLLEIGQMSFKTAEQRPGVRSIARILVRTTILTS